MWQAEQPDPLDVDAYLAAERHSQQRHEYVSGQVYAMAGASDRHNRIALRLAAQLDARVGDGPCQVFISDMKVRVAADIYYYPDVMVACDPPGSDPYIREQPRLVVEVISPSTKRIDRQEKRLAYAGIASLEAYLLIHTDRRRVEIMRRRPDGGWVLSVHTEPDEPIDLPAVDLTLTVAEIYRGIAFPEA